MVTGCHPGEHSPLSTPATLPTPSPSNASLYYGPANDSHALKDRSVERIA